MSFAVAQRTHEIGLRMALGASSGQILRQVLREEAVTALAGVALGSVGAFLVGRTMQGLLFGVAAMEPLAFAVVVLTLRGAPRRSRPWPRSGRPEPGCRAPGS
jgi:ABC-type antimicrobial peptide transport system permease subunit